MPYCLYVRKSRADAEAEARGEGETLTRHINTLLELAKKYHYDVTEIHKEIVSGDTIAARPEMQQLLLEVENGLWDGVLVMEVERLARGDTIDQGIVAQTFKLSGTKIITPVKIYDPLNEFDEEYFEFGLFMSRREYKTINRRLQAGRMASIKEGKFVGNKAPYGYKIVKLQNAKGNTLEPIEPEASIIKMIFDLYVNGEEQADGTIRKFGTSLITRRLNELHIPTKTGADWTPPVVAGILSNPTYCGKIRWNHRKTVKKVVDGKVISTRPRNKNYMIVEGLHPAIITEEMYNKAMDIKKSQSKPSVNVGQNISSPLAGLIVCKKCGRRMVRRPYGDRQPPSLMCPNTACANVSAPFDLVEHRVLEMLHEWLKSYTIKLNGSELNQDRFDEIAVKENALNHLHSERKRLSNQLDRTHDLLEQGIYTSDDFLSRSRKLSEEIKENDEATAKITAEIEILKKREESRQIIIPRVQHLLDVYYTLETAQEKNDMLKEVLEKVEYEKDKNGNFAGNSPDDFSLYIYPKMPDLD